MNPSVVSIIICTRNRADSLRETLESVGRVHVPEDMPAELLVVDNGSTDHTREVVEQATLASVPVRYVPEHRKGKGYAYNTGMAEAEGEIFLFTDDDCRVPEDWIEGMCRPILNGEADAVAGGVRLAPELEREWMTGWHRGTLAATDHLDPDNPAELVGANMAFHRRVLQLVPAFDTALGPGAIGFGDETLFSWQLLRAGFRLKGALHVLVVHHPEPSRLLRRSYLHTAEKLGRLNAYLNYHWRHQDCPNARRNLPRAIARLWLERLRHPYEALRREGIAEWERLKIWEIGYYRQFLREQGRPRAYERLGLKKRVTPDGGRPAG